MPNPGTNENAWKKAVADDEVGWAAPAPARPTRPRTTRRSTTARSPPTAPTA